jgi:hypothetical protein
LLVGLIDLSESTDEKAFDERQVQCYKSHRNQADYSPGLPDGIFFIQKSEFGNILEGHEMENVGLFFGHLECFTTIWYMYFMVIL